MRNIAWILVFVLIGCQHKDPVISVNANQLIGTWNSPSTLVSAKEKPFTRWTFKPDYVHTLEDTLKSCQPVDNPDNYKYWLEDDVLVTRYMGITIGPGPTFDIRRRIISITATELVLDGPRQVLEKCP